MADVQKKLAQLPMGRILGIDYGHRRLGLAASDPTQTLASPVMTVRAYPKEQVKREIMGIVKSLEAVAVVIGMPVHMDGQSGERTREVEAFIKEILVDLPVPYFVWDERWTTISAHKSLRSQGKAPSRNKKRVDQIAAAFILQAFLDRLCNIRAGMK